MNSSTTSSSDMNSDESSSPDITGYGYYTFGLSIGVLLLFSCITFAIYFFSRRNSNISEETQSSRDFHHLRTIMVAGDHHHSSSLSASTRRAGIDDSTLRSYPVVLYSEAKAKVDDSDWKTSCSICLGDYKESEWLRVLPECGHSFHRKCIDMWFRMNSSCPLCRNSPLPTPLAQVAPFATTTI